MFLTIGRPGVSEDSSIPSAIDNPIIRKALLRDFYGKFEKQFDEIWKLLRGGTVKSLAGELAKDDVAKVDVLVTIGANGAPYAKEATSTIPVVFVLVPDPLGLNLVKSIARPEANITGLSNSASDLIGKRLALFKEVIPRLSKVALLVNENSTLASAYETTTHEAAVALELLYTGFKWRVPDDLATTFISMKDAGIQAFIINPDGWSFTHRVMISKLAIENRLPLSAWSREMLNAGALMSYGVDHPAVCYRVAAFVSKLLKGATVGEVPVELPTTFEFLINLKTAKALGLTVPESVLLQATEVIE
jgi:putative ABC transport system substrate-binding protein